MPDSPEKRTTIPDPEALKMAQEYNQKIAREYFGDEKDSEREMNAIKNFVPTGDFKDDVIRFLEQSGRIRSGGSSSAGTDAELLQLIVGIRSFHREMLDPNSDYSKKLASTPQSDAKYVAYNEIYRLRPEYTVAAIDRIIEAYEKRSGNSIDQLGSENFSIEKNGSLEDSQKKELLESSSKRALQRLDDAKITNYKFQEEHDDVWKRSLKFFRQVHDQYPDIVTTTTMGEQRAGNDRIKGGFQMLGMLYTIMSDNVRTLADLPTKYLNMGHIQTTASIFDRAIVSINQSEKLIKQALDTYRDVVDRITNKHSFGVGESKEQALKEGVKNIMDTEDDSLDGVNDEAKQGPRVIN